MILRNSLFGPDVAEHSVLMKIVSAHLFLSEVGTKVKTIRNNSDWIEKQVAELQAELETEPTQMSKRIRAAVVN